jgi:hypothetical protein
MAAEDASIAGGSAWLVPGSGRRSTRTRIAPREGVRESGQEHQVSRGSARLPVDLANNPLTNDLEAVPEIWELASDATVKSIAGSSIARLSTRSGYTAM